MIRNMSIRCTTYENLEYVSRESELWQRASELERKKLQMDLFLPHCNGSLRTCPDTASSHSCTGDGTHTYHRTSPVKFDQTYEMRSDSGFEAKVDEDRSHRSGKTAEPLPPLLVFVHGGGWQRGDRKSVNYFLSMYDMNLLVYLLHWLINLHSNIGETFASHGIACAIVSYPLATLHFPWTLLEIICSYAMSLATLIMLYIVCLFTVHSYEWIRRITTSISPDASMAGTGDTGWHLCAGIHILIIAIILNITELIIMTKYRQHFCIRRKTLVFIWLMVLTSAIVVITCTGYTYISHDRALVVIFTMSCLFTQGLLFCQRANIHKPQTNIHSFQKRCIKMAINFLQECNFSKDRLYNTNSVFLMGHSAGAHLITMVTAETAIQRHIGLNTTIKGVIAISGVYDLAKLSHGFKKYLYLEPVFGNNPKDWQHNSPLQVFQKRDDVSFPPFLIINASRDFHLQDDAIDFSNVLTKHGVDARHHIVPWTNHLTIIWCFRKSRKTHITLLCLDFIHKYS